MPHSITTAPDLCQFLLTRMRATGPAVAYPTLFAAYVDQFIGNLSGLQRDTDRLYLPPAGNRCPCCGVEWRRHQPRSARVLRSSLLSCAGEHNANELAVESGAPSDLTLRRGQPR